jgi:hypothetical protein
MYEKIWRERLRWWYDDIVLTKGNDYKLIDLLDCYYSLYTFDNYDHNEMYKNYIEETLNEYRGNNNGDTIGKAWLSLS